MTKKEKEKLCSAWAKSNVLCGTLDTPEEHFLKGKKVVQEKLINEIHVLLCDLMKNYK